MIGKLDIYTINMKAFGVEPLTDGELQFAMGLVSSDETKIAIIANGILFLAGNETQRRNALNRIRIILQEGSQHQNPKSETALLGILEYFPSEELNDNPIYKDFVYRMAKSSFVPCRVNAMRVLRQFGKMGDHQAIVLLKERNCGF